MIFEIRLLDLWDLFRIEIYCWLVNTPSNSKLLGFSISDSLRAGMSESVRKKDSTIVDFRGFETARTDFEFWWFFELKMFRYWPWQG